MIKHVASAVVASAMVWVVGCSNESPVAVATTDQIQSAAVATMQPGIISIMGRTSKKYVGTGTDNILVNNSAFVSSAQQFLLEQNPATGEYTMKKFPLDAGLYVTVPDDQTSPLSVTTTPSEFKFYTYGTNPEHFFITWLNTYNGWLNYGVNVALRMNQTVYQVTSNKLYGSSAQSTETVRGTTPSGIIRYLVRYNWSINVPEKSGNGVEFTFTISTFNGSIVNLMYDGISKGTVGINQGSNTGKITVVSTNDGFAYHDVRISSTSVDDPAYLVEFSWK